MYGTSSADHIDENIEQVSTGSIEEEEKEEEETNLEDSVEDDRHKDNFEAIPEIFTDISEFNSLALSIPAADSDVMEILSGTWSETDHSHIDFGSQTNRLLYTDFLETLHSESGTVENTRRVVNVEVALALKKLKHGNARFVFGSATLNVERELERCTRASRYSPFVCVVACCDCHVSIERLFDQSFDDIYVVLVSGNIIIDVVLGSIEYALVHLKVKLIVVLGHDACATVNNAILLTQSDISLCSQITGEIEEDSHLLNFDAAAFIVPCVTLPYIQRIKNFASKLREATISNVEAQVQALRRNQVVLTRIRAGELLVIGGFYDALSGIVDFLQR